MTDSQTGNRKLRTIGVLAGWPAHEDITPDRYLITVFRGIQSAARRRGCHLLFAWGIGRGYHSGVNFPAWPQVSRETDFVPVGPWNTDGLIVFAPLMHAGRSQYVEETAAGGCPVLFIATGENGPAVLADNQNGIRMAVEHLVEHGHRRIAFIAGDPQDMGDSAQRLSAFWEAVRRHHLDDDPALVRYGNHNMADAYEVTQAMLAEGLKFSALLASDDTSAIGAMQAIKEAGLRIPQDVAVAGFDDQPDAMAQTPPLTSVHVPLGEIGKRALELLLDHLEGAAPLDSICVPTYLVRRQSCGCLPHAVVSAGQSQPSADGPAAAGLPETSALFDRLAGAMAASLPPAALPLDDLASLEMCRTLAEAFHQSLESRQPAAFEAALLEVLDRLEQSEAEIHLWQVALTTLRRGLQAVGWGGPGRQTFGEDLLHEGRAAISESVHRRFSQYLYKRNASDYLLSELNARLNTITDEIQAVELLTEKLPELGIKHTRLNLFEAEGDDPVAWSVLIGAGQNPDLYNFRFPTRQFPPPHLYPPGELLNLAVVPLVHQNEALGYIAFDANNIEPCSAIARQFVANIKSARLHAQVVDLSLTDALTGLHNRRYFDLFLDNEIKRTRLYGGELAIIFIDIDHFKDYNDSYGHPTGDDALKIVSHCLLDHHRKTDVVARIGGEEFAVILKETGLAGAVDVANKMRTAVASAAGFRRPITISLGVAGLQEDASTAKALVEHADRALYEAKHTGRNRVCAFGG